MKALGCGIGTGMARAVPARCFRCRTDNRLIDCVSAVLDRLRQCHRIRTDDDLLFSESLN
jgi:hypothetical protein